MVATPREMDFTDPDKVLEAPPDPGYHPPSRKARKPRVVKDPARVLVMEPGTSFKTETTTWLLQDRIPLGELTLVAGREGTGKGLFMSHLIARITRGKLTGHYWGRPSAVAIAAHEDSWHKTLAPRLRVAGADMSKVFRIAIKEKQGKRMVERRWSIPDDLPFLVNAAVEHGVVMVAVDPLISAIDSDVDLFKSPKVRPVLEAFRKTLEDANIAGFGIVHFNKVAEGDSMSKIANARAVVEVARAAIVLAEDKESDEPGTVIVSQPRNNLGRTDLPNMAFRKVGVDFTADDGGTSSVGKLQWISKNYERTADDALNTRPPSRRGPTSYERVIEYLMEVGRPVTAGEVAKATGVREDTVRQCLTRGVGKASAVLVKRGTYQATKRT